MIYIIINIVAIVTFMLNVNIVRCELCDLDLKLSQQSFHRLHLKKQHGITSKQYYDMFIRKGNEGICYCGKKTKYKNFNEGYCNCCSNKCASLNQEKTNKIKHTKKDRYGSEKYNNRDLAIKTMLDRYGVNNVSKLDVVKSKKINNSLKKYGVKNPLQNKSVFNKSLKTKKEKYNNEKYNNRDLAKKTMISRYGFDSYSKTKEYRKYLEDNGLCIPESQLSSFKKYFMKVYNITRSNKKTLFKNWNGKCYYTNKKLNFECHYNNKYYPVVDHKISIYYGFKESISEEEIGSIKNLCICTRECNGKKNKLTEKQFKKLCLI